MFRIPFDPLLNLKPKKAQGFLEILPYFESVWDLLGGSYGGDLVAY